jgi:hypothetical protein
MWLGSKFIYTSVISGCPLWGVGVKKQNPSKGYEIFEKH